MSAVRSDKSALAALKYVLLIAVVLAVAAGLYFAFITWFLFSGSGPSHAGSEPPSSFGRMLSLAGASRAAADYRNLGGFVDTQHAWRLPVAASKLDRILTEFRLEPLATSDVPRGAMKVFPWQWRPDPSRGLKYFSTPGFSFSERGEDGDHFFVVYDDRDGRLYVWLKANF